MFAFLTPVGIVLVILIVFGIVAGGYYLGKSLRTQKSRPVANPNELADLREKVADLSEEVAELREEVERLKRHPDARGSTGIKEI